MLTSSAAAAVGWPPPPLPHTECPTLSTPSSLPTLIDIGSREGMVNNDQGTCALLKGGGGWFVRDLTPPPRAGGR